MTNEEFKAARHRLGLTLGELGRILNTTTTTIVKWEAPETASTSRRPNPVACQAMAWMLDGFRPPEWPTNKH